MKHNLLYSKNRCIRNVLWSSVEESVNIIVHDYVTNNFSRDSLVNIDLHIDFLEQPVLIASTSIVLQIFDTIDTINNE